MDLGTDMTYKVQIDDLVRDATPDESIVLQQLAEQYESENAAIAAAKAAKESARNKLKALGLTDNEIAALVG
jgi:hypothetical protein